MFKELKISWILAILIGGSIAVIDYSYHNPKDDYTYCLRNKPIKNYTNTRDNICFTKEWDRYCGIIAPSQCQNAYLNWRWNQ